MRYWLGTALGLVLAGTSSCADLDPMTERVCGNGVVDRATEDCDGFPAGQCRGPDEDFACRLQCDPNGADLSLQCPVGWTCGEDEICRQHSGAFEQQTTIDIGAEAQLFTGDFDRDGNDDLVTDSAHQLGVHFNDRKGNAVEAVTLSPVKSAPIVGQLTDDDSGADLALNHGALMVRRGQTDRTLQPTMYSSYEFMLDGAEVFLMDVLPPRIVDDELGNPVAMFSGDEVVFLFGDQIKVQASGGLANVADFPDGFTTDHLVGTPRVGNVIDHAGSPCEELVFLLEGHERIFIYSPCTPDTNTTFTLAIDDGALHPAVLLPYPATPEMDVLLAHVNDDSHLDILVSLDWFSGGEPVGDGEAFLFVAYGLGDGTFHSSSDDLNGQTVVVDETAGAQFNVELLSRPLAAGRLNKDAYIDLVTADGILLSTPESTSQAIEDIVYRPPESSSNLWTDAEVVDVNQNGLLDVVAFARGEGFFAFFNNAGDAFNRYEIPLDDPGLLLGIGDFDGDLLPDIAVVEGVEAEGDPQQSTPSVMPGNHTLTVAFGSPVGGPSAPVKMGRLPTIEQLVVGRLDRNGFDGMDDLMIVTRTPGETANVAVLTGSTTRQLVSPLYLADKGSSARDYEPVAMALGHFDGDDDHLDVAVLAVDADASIPTGVTPPNGGGDGPGSDGDGADGIDGSPGWLWLLPATGEAAIERANARPSDQLPYGLVASGSLMGAVDLNGDGVDELVLLSETLSEADGSCVGTLAIASADYRPSTDSVRSWALVGDAQIMSESFSTNSVDGFCGAVFGPLYDDPQAPLDDPGFDDELMFATEYQGHLEVVDIDGDGRDEVVALGKTVQLSFDMPTYMSSIIIFPNGASGTIDAAAALKPANLTAAPPTAFTFLNADDDKALEIVVVTAEGAFLADVDLKKGELVNETFLDHVRGGRRVTSADFNGDGLADLAVGDESTVTVYLGVPRLP